MFYRRFLVILILLSIKFNVFPQSKSEVHLKGISPDSSVTRISIAKTQRFFASSGIDFLVKSNSVNGHFDLKFIPDGNCFVRIFQLNKTWQMYVKPGDSVEFILSKKDEPNSIIFYGTSAGRYNALAETQFEETQHFNKDNLSVYKIKVENWKDKCDSIAKKYYKNKKIDKVELDLILEDVLNRYVALTYEPLMSIEHIEVAPLDYLNKVGEIKLKDRKGILSERYLSAINLKYVKVYDLNPKYAFQNKFNSIKKELKGISMEFALASLISHYAEKQRWKDHSMMLEALSFAKKHIKDSLYTSMIKLAETRYFLQQKPLPDSILDTVFLTKYETGEKISIRDIFNEYKNKGIYIDLWASWCEPCIDEIENSYPGIDLLKKNNYVNIYISIDQNKDKWIAASKLYNITKNQYLITYEQDHPLLKFLALQSIPRYLLFDSQHRIISIYAPRPSAYNINELRRAISSDKTQ